MTSGSAPEPVIDPVLLLASSTAVSTSHTPGLGYVLVRPLL